MDLDIKFLGGAHTVTGSKYLLDFRGPQRRHQVLVDCGLFQGLKELRLRNREALPLEPADIETVVLTHAHIDHTGYLPRLYKDGFRGRILCTAATHDMLRILLLDSAKLQEEEAAFANHHGYSKHRPALPLYTTADAERVLELVQSFGYDTPVPVADGVSVVFRDAGHILGSAIVQMQVQGDEQLKRLVFSGDLGRYDTPLLHDPTPIATADVLLVESTYGNRDNRIADPEGELARIVNEALARGGCLVIPAFAVGRTQTLLYYLKRLRRLGRIPRVPVYVDSPMAISVSGLYPRHPDDHKLGEGNVFEFDGLRFVQEQSESKNLNSLGGGAIIISASGMCTGGRILHHLTHRLPRANDTVLLVGYQAEGTRGRSLQEGATTIKIFGEQVPVRCHVTLLDGFSAHADRSELLRWLGHFSKPPKRTFVVHGDEAGALGLQQALAQELHWPSVIVPEHLQTVELFRGI